MKNSAKTKKKWGVSDEIARKNAMNNGEMNRSISKTNIDNVSDLD